MKINKSGATYSSIVGIGDKIKKEEKDKKIKFLPLQRGVNQVVNIELNEISKNIDFNSNDLQIYAPNLGVEKLRKSILKEYFPAHNEKNYTNISILNGGMPALDLCIQTLNVDNILFPKFYWGSYSKMATIRNKSFSFYDDLSSINLAELNSSTCIFICDPNNPTGIKLNDELLLHQIQKINDTGAVIIFDSPYRKLFEDSTHIKYDIISQLSLLNNVIIVESFSKWLGLSGARLGFIWCSNKDFNDELNIRLLYQFNSISTLPQLLINELISTNEGSNSIYNFRKTTVKHITDNINYLKERNLLCKEIYNDNIPIGIFAVINLSEDFLFKNKIGAVGMDKFVYHDKDYWSDYSRICVSVPHEKFVEYFNKIQY